MTCEVEPRYYEYCPICSSSIFKWKIKETETESYRIDRCSLCGFAFVNPRPSIQFLMNYYSSYGHEHGVNDAEKNATIDSVMEAEKKFPNSTIDAKRIISTVNLLNPIHERSKFLDVGCGYGFFSKEASVSGFEVTALEIAAVEREIASKMTNLNPIAISFEEFEYPDNSFSVILMSQILEHAYDVNLWAAKAHSLLEENGIIVIALPNFGSIFRLIMQENEPYICPPSHLNFFNLNSLSKLLEGKGFKVEKTQWVSRIAPQALKKRFPKLFSGVVLPIFNGMAIVLLKTLDLSHVGVMINIYARKIGA